jgi:hypothetical protein
MGNRQLAELVMTDHALALTDRAFRDLT